MPIIKARSSSIIDSVDLRGTPTAVTAASGTNTTQIASTAFVSGAVSDLVASAPAVLDTLSELASALGNDADFATTVANSIGTKVSLAGDTMTGFLTLHADPSSNLHAATKQYVDDLINNQMIYSTDDVSEGITNLYYTDSRVRAAVALTSDNTTVLDYDSASGTFTYNHPTSDGILEGVTNRYYTDARARGAISLTTANNTILSYSSSTGEFTYTTPDTDKVAEGATNLYFTTARARNSISVSGAGSYDSATGIIDIQGGVTSVNGQTGVVVLDTDNISEGSANLYFTNARAAGAVSLTTDDSNILSYNAGTGEFTFVTPSTDSITEGAANLYYTDARVRAAVSASGDISYNSGTGNFSYSTPTTDGVNEGSSNLYFTNSRARQAVSLTTDNADVLSYDSSTGTFTFSLGDQNTDDVAEGSTNLYFTDARARSAVSLTSAWNIVSYDSATGVFDVALPNTDDVAEGSTNQYFTQTRARGSVSAIHSAGDGNLTYDNTTGVFDYVGPDDSDYRGAVSANHVSGDGNLQYDSATGVFSYDGPTNADYRGAVSAFRASGDGNLQYDSATGVFTYTGPSSSEVRAHLSATTSSGITYDSATGVFALASIPNASLTNSDITINGTTISLGDSGSIDTDAVTEGANNLYYTQARFDSALAAKSTDDVAEGSNLYYTTARTRADVSAGTGVTYTQATGVFEIGQAVGTSDNVTFNDVTVGGNLTVNGTLTTINSTDLSVTDKNITIAEGAADAAAANGAGITVDGANATITYASGTDSWEFNKDVNVAGDVSMTGSLTAPSFTGDLTGDVTGNVTGNVTGDLTGDVTGTVSDISNHDTDALAEGTTNLYFTDARARNALSGGNSGTGFGSLSYDSATGAFTFTKVTSSNIRGEVSATKVSGDGNFSYDSATGTFSYTGPDDADYRLAISVNKTGGDGNIAYDDSTGVISFTGPSATDTRAHFSATSNTGITYDSATGVFALASIPNSSLSNDTVTFNGVAVALGTSGSFGTDSVTEETNLYFTDARARSAISLTTSDATVFSYDSATGTFTYNATGLDTDEVAEGSTNLYFTQARARQSISASSNWANVSYDDSTGVISVNAPDTDDVSEGATNLYFTDARARQAISLTTDNTDALSYDNTTGTFTFTLNSVDTDEIVEGATNLYFTTARARNTISAGANISYDAATGIISSLATVESVNGQTGVVVLDTDDISEGSANLYFTDARARSAITLSSDNASILDYNTGTGLLTFVTPDTDAIAEGAANLYYTDARADARIAAASVRDLSDVDDVASLNDGFTLVWSSSAQKFVPQNVTVSTTTANFTGDGTTTSFNTELEILSIENTQVFINGLFQAPTYSYTLSTTNGETSIVFDAAPETNDYIMVRVISGATLNAQGVLNENSTVDGGSF